MVAQSLLALLSNSGYRDLSDADAVAALNAATVPYSEPEPYSVQGLTKAFGLTRVTGWMSALKAASLDWIVTTLSSKGLVLSDPAVIAELDVLVGVGVLSADDARDIKALGTYHRSPWIAAGESGTVTLAEVQEARGLLARQALRDRFVGATATTLAAIDAGSITTWQAALTAMGA